MSHLAFHPPIPLFPSTRRQTPLRPRFVAVASPPSSSRFPPDADYATQLAQTLRTLETNVSSPPAELKEHGQLQKLLASAEGETLTSEEILRIATGAAGLDADEWESPEQNALLEALGVSVDVESSDEAFSLDEEDTLDGGLLPERVSQKSAEDSLLLDPQPRAVNIRAVKRRLAHLKRRRSKLAEARSSETPPARDLSSDAVGGELRGALEARAREQELSLIPFSLARSSVVDLEEEGRDALTHHTALLIANNARAPMMGRPLLGLQMAHERARNPPCPRCGRALLERESVSGEEICGTCYTEIYLVERVGKGQGAVRIWDEDGKKEKIREEERAAEQAVAISWSMLDSQSGRPKRSGRAASRVTMAVSENEAKGTREKGVARSSVGAVQERRNGSGSVGNSAPPPTFSSKTRKGDGWEVLASERSLRTINPIRNLIQNITVKPNPEKELIKLSIGDPTVYGNLKASEEAKKRFCKVIESDKDNGYTMSMGSEEGRAAVAKRYTTGASPLGPDDVVLTAGTSGALETAIGAIANEGDNILLPQPGFPLFRTIAEGYGIECRYYQTNPDRNWEIDFGSLVEIADGRTKAILVNNPSNPCGSVFSSSHIEDLMATASMLKLPIIADEVYADMLFSDSEFTPMGSKSIDVPVLSVGGISKQFVVPGWRLGWILIHDRNGVFEKGGVRKGIRQLTTRMLVPNSPAQAVLPTLLAKGVEDPAFKAVMEELTQNAKFTMQALSGTRGLRLIEPQGAMYAMAEVDVELLGLKDDMEFTEKLLEEEAVFVLPGKCFQAKNFVRIVFAAPKQVLSEAFFRIRSFCARRSGSL